MCGIAGFLAFDGFSETTARDALSAQIVALAHRGPDDAGIWIDKDAGIAMGHRRLSILDLSPAGHQPMVSASGRYVIVLNGEIYNHLEFRDRLVGTEAPPWRGHSDTESLLAVIDRWGVEFALRISSGMFAFAVWDRHARTLTLARDRMGEKPLYYTRQGGSLIFASELKAMCVHPDVRIHIDAEVLPEYMRHGYIRAPRCIYRDIFKLVPGTFLQVHANQSDGWPAPRSYWSLSEAVQQGRANQFRGDDEEAALALEDLLGRSVSEQSIADVPLGAFLSGGIDSSLVVALMQARSAKPIKTFTIGFNESAYNEAEYAKAVAEHLATDHTELYVDSGTAAQVIPKLPAIFDEPFGDSSAIPTYLVSKLARSKVSVSLSGDGGDELFGGYTRYQRTHNIWRTLRGIPHPFRQIMSYGAQRLEALASATSIGPVLHRTSQYLLARDAQECYAMQFSHHYGMPSGLLGVSATSTSNRVGFGLRKENIFDHMMYQDLVSYLPDDILFKVDRASMSVSLESRIPLLDYRVVEFAWRLPLHLKVRHGEGKWLLKKILRKHVPPGLVDRKKMGFGVPVGHWIRGPLRGWAQDLLSTQRLRQQGIFDPEIVNGRLTQFLKGGRISSDSIWQLLTFQSWLDGQFHSN